MPFTKPQVKERKRDVFHFPTAALYSVYLPPRLFLQFNLTKRTQFRDVLQEMRNTKKLRRVKKAAGEDRPPAGVSLARRSQRTVDFTAWPTLGWETGNFGVKTDSPPTWDFYLAGFTRGPQRLQWRHLSERLDIQGDGRRLSIQEARHQCQHAWCWTPKRQVCLWVCAKKKKNISVYCGKRCHLRSMTLAASSTPRIA